MRFWDKKRPAEVMTRSAQLERAAFQVEHRAERAVDQQQALSQLRAAKRKAKNGGNK